jgi:hypothetical protein
MDDVRVVEASVDHGAEQVMRPGKVIVDGVAHLSRSFHRIGRRPLLRETHNRLRLFFFQQVDEFRVFLPDRNISKPDFPSRGVFPSVKARFWRTDWGSTTMFQARCRFFGVIGYRQ